MTQTQSVTILCGIGEYPVDLTDGITVNDLPRLIAGNGGIVVPVVADDVDHLFIPASQIQGITWAEEEIIAEVGPEDLAEVAFIGEEEPSTDIEDPGEVPAPPTGPNGEVFIDA